MYLVRIMKQVNIQKRSQIYVVIIQSIFHSYTADKNTNTMVVSSAEALRILREVQKYQHCGTDWGQRAQIITMRKYNLQFTGERTVLSTLPNLHCCGQFSSNQKQTKAMRTNPHCSLIAQPWIPLYKMTFSWLTNDACV